MSLSSRLRTIAGLESFFVKLIVTGIIFDILKSTAKRAVKLSRMRLSKISPSHKLWAEIGVVMGIIVTAFAAIPTMVIYYLAPIYGFNNAAIAVVGTIGMTMTALAMVRDSNGRSILIEKLFKPLNNRYSIKVDKLSHPEDYNPDGSRKTPWLD